MEDTRTTSTAWLTLASTHAHAVPENSRSDFWKHARANARRMYRFHYSPTIPWMVNAAPRRLSRRSRIRKTYVVIIRSKLHLFELILGYTAFFRIVI